MKKYIAYFDYLGYKSFIENNSHEDLAARSQNLVDSMARALSDKILWLPNFAQTDLSEVNINWINISDTTIFWTNNDDEQSLIDIIQATYNFNYQSNIFQFPLRGCLIHDTFDAIIAQKKNLKGTVFSPNFIYGKGLFNAHELCNSLEWAGSVIHESVMKRMKYIGFDSSKYSNIFKEYSVPTKRGCVDYFAFLLGHQLSEKKMSTQIKHLERVFSWDKKEVNESAKRKLENTIEFLKTELIE